MHGYVSHILHYITCDNNYLQMQGMNILLVHHLPVVWDIYAVHKLRFKYEDVMCLSSMLHQIYEIWLRMSILQIVEYCKNVKYVKGLLFYLCIFPPNCMQLISEAGNTTTL